MAGNPREVVQSHVKRGRGLVWEIRHVGYRVCLTLPLAVESTKWLGADALSQGGFLTG